MPTRERQDEYARIPEAPLQIEEAVVCIARAIFMEGGTLVFGAHPSISPLVARVVDNYYLPAPAEEARKEPAGDDRHPRWRNPSVVIFQSRVWEEHWAEATQHLARHPLVNIEWTEAEPGERVDLQIKDRSQAPGSLARMRETMIAKFSPVAMIAIGGMKGVIDEAKLFARLRPGKPIFTFATTGGAAALLAREESIREHVRVVDAEAGDLVRKFWEQQGEQIERRRWGQEGRKEPTEQQVREFYVPYAFVAQQIVAELCAGLQQG